jgi:hypothetical protein
MSFPPPSPTSYATDAQTPSLNLPPADLTIHHTLESVQKQLGELRREHASYTSRQQYNTAESFSHQGKLKDANGIVLSSHGDAQSLLPKSPSGQLGKQLAASAVSKKHQLLDLTQEDATPKKARFSSSEAPTEVPLASSYLQAMPKHVLKLREVIAARDVGPRSSGPVAFLQSDPGNTTITLDDGASNQEPEETALASSPDAGSPSRNAAEPNAGTIEQTIETHPGMSDRDLIRHLYDTIADLRSQIKTLQEELRAALDFGPVEPPPPRLQVFHRVTCDCDPNRQVETVYQDHPEFIGGAESTNHVQGRLRISDIHLYLDRNSEVALIVYKEYACGKSNLMRRMLLKKARQNNMPPPDDPSAILCSESLSIISVSLCTAVKEVFKYQENVSYYPKVEVRGEIKAPYTFFYHDRITIKQEVLRLPQNLQEAISLFMNYFEENLTKEFCNADEQFYQAKVSSETIQYLFEPGQVVLQYQNGELLSYYADSYLQRESSDNWSLRTWSWHFDGQFWKEKSVLSVKYTGPADDVMSIADLHIHPLGYAGPEVEKQLRARGARFWSCRYRKYVCYRDKDVWETRDVRLQLRRVEEPINVHDVDFGDLERFTFHDRLQNREESWRKTSLPRRQTTRIL